MIHDNQLAQGYVYTNEYEYTSYDVLMMYEAVYGENMGKNTFSYALTSSSSFFCKITSQNKIDLLYPNLKYDFTTLQEVITIREKSQQAVLHNKTV